MTSKELIAKMKYNDGIPIFVDTDRFSESIWLGIDDCTICNERKICLFVDNSDDEYGSSGLCLDCIKKIFNGELELSTKD